MTAQRMTRFRRRRIRFIVVTVVLAVVVTTAISLARALTADTVSTGLPGFVAGGDPAHAGNAGNADGADGAIDDAFGISPFDDDDPAIALLQPELRAALQQAALDAAADEIEMRLTGGWRSAGYQKRLLDDAVREYGSEDEAKRYVRPPGMSSHNTGDAVDVGMTDASYWMIRNGYRYGLCQTFENEIWHFELSVAPGETCPPPVADAAAVD